MQKTMMCAPAAAAADSVTVAVTVRHLNEHIACCICFGYLVDATTIIECLHSFCRSCIVQYLDTSDSCPMCGHPVNTMNPLSGIRSDRKLQELVYKLVPRLYADEMKRRREFYAIHSIETEDATRNNAEDIGDVHRDPALPEISDDCDVSICILYYDRRQSDTLVNEKSVWSYRRYLQCPALLRVHHLQKFIRQKLNLDSFSEVWLFSSKCDSSSLDSCLTLVDVANHTGWKMRKPLRLYFAIYRHLSSAIDAENRSTAVCYSCCQGNSTTTKSRRHTVRLYSEFADDKRIARITSKQVEQVGQKRLTDKMSFDKNVKKRRSVDKLGNIPRTEMRSYGGSWKRKQKRRRKERTQKRKVRNIQAKYKKSFAADEVDVDSTKHIVGNNGVCVDEKLLNDFQNQQKVNDCSQQTSKIADSEVDRLKRVSRSIWNVLPSMCASSLSQKLFPAVSSCSAASESSSMKCVDSLHVSVTNSPLVSAFQSSSLPSCLLSTATVSSDGSGLVTADDEYIGGKHKKPRNSIRVKFSNSRENADCTTNGDNNNNRHDIVSNRIESSKLDVVGVEDWIGCRPTTGDGDVDRRSTLSVEPATRSSTTLVAASASKSCLTSLSTSFTTTSLAPSATPGEETVRKNHSLKRAVDFSNSGGRQVAMADIDVLAVVQDTQLPPADSSVSESVDVDYSCCGTRHQQKQETSSSDSGRTHCSGEKLPTSESIETRTLTPSAIHPTSSLCLEQSSTAEAGFGGARHSRLPAIIVRGTMAAVMQTELTRN